MHSFKWQKVFDEDYFENGVETGTSLYTSYRWMPEMTIPMACRLKGFFPGKSIMDFGCAKGYLVYALRLLDVQAYGFDVSCYALDEASKEIRPFLYCPDDKHLPQTDVLFIKDTLEHVNENEIVNTLNTLRNYCKEALVIVPFGDNGKYRIEEYELDVTHQIRKNEAWWQRQFTVSKFSIEKMVYQLDGFKDNWRTHPCGNGFFFLKSMANGAA